MLQLLLWILSVFIFHDNNWCFSASEGKFDFSNYSEWSRLLSGKKKSEGARELVAQVIGAYFYCNYKVVGLSLVGIR